MARLKYNKYQNRMYMYLAHIQWIKTWVVVKSFEQLLENQNAVGIVHLFVGVILDMC